MKKQTAVEWFYQRILSKDIKAVFEKAKEMEKEQLKQLMWDLTEIDMAEFNKGLIIDDRFDTYYNETFKP